MNTQINSMKAWKDPVTYREQNFFHKNLNSTRSKCPFYKCFNVYGSIHVFGALKISTVVHNQENLLCSWSELFTFFLSESCCRNLWSNMQLLNSRRCCRKKGRQMEGEEETEKKGEEAE